MQAKVTRIQLKRQYLIEHRGWSDAELAYKTYIHSLPDTASVETYQRRILAEAAKDRMSKTLMAKIIGVNEKLLRGWEKRFRDLPPPPPPPPPAPEVFSSSFFFNNISFLIFLNFFFLVITCYVTTSF